MAYVIGCGRNSEVCDKVCIYVYRIVNVKELVCV